MKVYELMKELSELPSGAEVRFNALMTLEKFSESEMADNEYGEDGRILSFDIKEVSEECCNVVTLYN